MPACKLVRLGISVVELLKLGYSKKEIAKAESQRGRNDLITLSIITIMRAFVL